MAYIGVPPADRTSGARVRDEFTADGTQVCFQLSQEVPGSFESNIIAIVENVIQEPVSAYTIINTVTLSLTNISGTFTVNETVTGGTSSAEGTVIQANLSNVVVRVTSGIFQNSEEITGGDSGATADTSAVDTNVGRGVLFSGTPTTGSVIYVLHQNAATYQLKPAAGSVTPETLSENLRTFTVDKFTATASQTAFTLTATPVSVKSILVFVDGVMQTETTHYTLSGAVVTMGSGLADGQQVTVVHLGFSTVSRTAFADSTVTTAMIADGAITSDKIADGTVIASDVADGSITTAKLNSTLDLSGKTITYRTIVEGDIADSAITSAKIANGTIVAGDIASDAITTAKILDANVTSGKLASGAAVSNIGYTPANKAGDTFTGVVNHDIGSAGDAVYYKISGTVKGRVSLATVSDSFGTGDRIYIGDGSTDVFVGTSNGSQTPNNSYIALNHSGEVSIGAGAGTKHMIIDTNGYVRMPYQIAFNAYCDANLSGAKTPVVFNQTRLNRGSGYNTSTGRFTAPVAGAYFFSVTNNVTNANGMDGLIRKNGSNIIGVEFDYATGGNWLGLTCTTVIELAVGDYVDYTIGAGAGYTVETTPWNNFVGYLIG